MSRQQQRPVSSGRVSVLKNRLRTLPGTLLLAGAALHALPLTAQMAVTAFGTSEAQGCFIDASDGFSTSTWRCELALREAGLNYRDRLATLVNQGIILNRAGSLDEALASFDQALRAEQNLPEAWLNRGNTLYLRGDALGAIAHYEAALAHGLERAHIAWYNIGLVHESQSDRQTASSAFAEALALNPGFTLAEEKLRLASASGGQ